MFQRFSVYLDTQNMQDEYEWNAWVYITTTVIKFILFSLSLYIYIYILLLCAFSVCFNYPGWIIYISSMCICSLFVLSPFSICLFTLCWYLYVCSIFQFVFLLKYDASCYDTMPNVFFPSLHDIEWLFRLPYLPQIFLLHSLPYSGSWAPCVRTILYGWGAFGSNTWHSVLVVWTHKCRLM